MVGSGFLTARGEVIDTRGQETRMIHVLMDQSERYQYEFMFSLTQLQMTVYVYIQMC